MITSDHQDYLCSWLCKRIGLTPTAHLTAIGRISGSKVLGIVGYDGFNGASIQMHSAGEGNWVNRNFLWAAFHYPFDVCKANVVLGLIPSGNTQAIKFNQHLGFKIAATIPNAHPDGALIIMSMTRQECRFLKERVYGQEIQSTSRA